MGKNKRGCLKFWGKNLLEVIGMSALGAVILFVLVLLRDREVMAIAPAVLGSYVLIFGLFIVSLVSMTYFQVYFSVMVSLGCTRKNAVLQILGVTVVSAAILALISVTLLSLTAEIGALRWDGIFAAMFGVGLGFSSLFVVLGVSSVRWGKIGVLIAMLLYAGFGAVFGFSVASSFAGDSLLTYLAGILAGISMRLRADYGLLILLIGAALYLISGIFAFFSMRQIEVRR